MSFILFACTQNLAGQAFHQIPAGSYTVGGNANVQNPRRVVQTNGFELSEEITNREFSAFIGATGYLTDAERLHRAMVFFPGLREFQWMRDSTACWRFPNGRSRGGIDAKMNHPVTTISYSDALAYCAWKGVRLPALTEWEIAARAGSKTKYFWGNDAKKIGRYANIWHGRNHQVADNSDGFLYTAPVGSFLPNAFGLHDMYGNVFEFCTGHLPDDRDSTTVHARGGSWWCSQSACNFFNSEDIGHIAPHASFSNMGFRVARSLPEK